MKLPVLLVVLVLGLAVHAEESTEALRRRISQLEGENASLKADNTRLRQRLGEPAPAAVTQPVAPAPAAPADLKRLEEDNRKLREQLAQSQAQAQPATPAAIAPLSPGKSYSVDEFIGLLSGNFLGAEAAYRGQKVRIRGTVDKMEKVYLSTTHKIYLRGATPVRLVQCRIPFSGKYNPALTPDGGTLRGTKPFGDDFVFMRVGEEITVEGEFDGMKDNVLVLEKAAQIK